MRDAIRIGLLAAVMATAQAPEAPHTGAQAVTFVSSVDGTDQPYALYVPRAFRPDQKYPLIVTLHAEESNHRQNLRQVFGAPYRFGEADPQNMRTFPAVRDEGFVVAAPLARGTMGYQGIPERDVYDMLADVERRLPIDPDRVYLTGVSMGGAGALWMGLTRPDVWAAVAAVCPSTMPGTEELAPNALNLPIRLFHGDQDPIVSVENSRAWQRRLLAAGAPADYLEYPGLRHNAWDFAYRNGAILDWFSQFRRNRFPERVRVAADTYRYASAYWVRIDGLTPGTLGWVDARRTAPSDVQVQTSRVDGFTLTLDRPVSLVTIDGTAVRFRPAAKTLSFTRAGGRWRPGLFQPAGKRAGAEGPIAEAVSGRHLYVYGTRGGPGPDELEIRRKTAESAAQWSSPRARLGLRFAVKADTEVTSADLEGGSLVLFGNAETNSVLARFAPQFPLTLNPGAADWGLLFIIPTGKHYALVSSGLPWWTGAADARRGGYPLAPPQFRLLSTFGDYIVFKGSLANVVAEGRFDSNWKVPADAAQKILAGGTVTIR